MSVTKEKNTKQNKTKSEAWAVINKYHRLFHICFGVIKLILIVDIESYKVAPPPPLEVLRLSSICHPQRRPKTESQTAEGPDIRRPTPPRHVITKIKPETVVSLPPKNTRPP